MMDLAVLYNSNTEALERQKIENIPISLHLYEI